MVYRESKTAKYRKVWDELYTDASTWRSHWADIRDYIAPRSGRYLTGDNPHNDGSKKHQKIINSTATEAVRIAAAGLQGGLTSPSRPWFQLALADRDLMEYEPVKHWLERVRNGMQNIFSRSNFYGAIYSLYKELVLFGTGSMLSEEDFQTVSRYRTFTVGEYYLVLDSRYRAIGLYRKFALTPKQMIDTFGEENVSDAVKSQYENNEGSQKKFDIIHVIQKKDEVDYSKGDSRGMLFESVYYELNGDHDKILRSKGYRTLPFVAPRWSIIGVDTYGESPAMEALGDVRMLQKMEEKKLKALGKMVDPPMNADNSLKAKGGTIIAGGVNYHDMSAGKKFFEPVYQVNPDFQNLAFEIDRVERRIDRLFYKDIFLAIIQEEKNMTATEIAKRMEEKYTMLGPVIERIQSELLDPIIDRLFDLMIELNVLPPAPQEIANMDLKVEYISLLAQAQKMVGTTSIERLSGFVGNIASVIPEAVDKFDHDEAIDQYADMLGVPVKIVRAGDKVLKIRQARAEARQLAQQKEDLANTVQGAKTLSETQMNKDSALDSLMSEGEGA